jgi:hypothetical protein
MPTNPLLTLIEVRKRRLAVDVTFDDLFLFSQFVEVALIERSAEHHATAITSELFYPDRVTDDDIERFQNERQQLQHEFPHALRIAVLGLTHSRFETQMVATARLVAKCRGLELSEAVKTVWRAKTFLEKDCGLEPDSESWHLFKAYQSVRHAFVHNDGRVDLPLNDGSDLVAAARQVGAEIRDSRVLLTRSSAAEFVLLCRRICMSLLQCYEGRAR